MRRGLQKRCSTPSTFQCSSASRKFLNASRRRMYQTAAPSFSALQRAENSSIWRGLMCRRLVSRVSVLFSEPKIPQWRHTKCRRTRFGSFSALQRAENSSIARPKHSHAPSSPRFSALQRAENSSMADRRLWFIQARRFQCSSASRKFLNRDQADQAPESASVSVLFSEPKIPQLCRSGYDALGQHGFSALQRAENSSIILQETVTTKPQGFQCSSASRKFLNQ